ncbi:hypothetical protein [Kordiimonas sp.]
MAALSEVLGEVSRETVTFICEGDFVADCSDDVSASGVHAAAQPAAKTAI